MTDEGYMKRPKRLETPRMNQLGRIEAARRRALFQSICPDCHYPLDACLCEPEEEHERLERIEAEYLRPPERGSW
jgi:hypothetical protein